MASNCDIIITIYDGWIENNKVYALVEIANKLKLIERELK